MIRRVTGLNCLFFRQMGYDDSKCTVRVSW